MKKLKSQISSLVILKRRTLRQDRQLGTYYRKILHMYQDSVAAQSQKLPKQMERQHKLLVKLARKAMLYLAGEGEPRSTSLKDYDHKKYGPYLGVSDEGSAAHIIRKAALSSPKMHVAKSIDPLVVGVAHDAERLGAIGEVPVGPEEYTDIRLQCFGRILTSTNVGTRLNLRYYKEYPTVYLQKGSRQKLLNIAKKRITENFEPFLKTIDGRPRPLIVFIRFGRETLNRVFILKELRRFVTKGGIAEPTVHRLGLLTWIRSGKKGKEDAFRAIDLAHEAGLKDVALEGIVRGEARSNISLPGILNYLAPGLVGPILRRALDKRINVYPKHTVDPDTVARNVWSALNSARHMGLDLGKYGTFPLTLEECDEVIGKVQGWFKDWTAAPVFFVDQGILSRKKVYVGNDVVSGLKEWLKVIKRHRVPVVLIDTVDKSKGWRLLRTRNDPKGLLGPLQIKKIDRLAASMGIKVLWAGGISLAQTFEFGKMSAFGIYVTSAAATKGPISIDYERDPLLASLKEPTIEGVSRAKLLLEAGFLVEQLKRTKYAKSLEESASAFIAAIDRFTRIGKTGSDKKVKRINKEVSRLEHELFQQTIAAWKIHLRNRN